MRPPCSTTGSNWAPAAAPSWTSRSIRSKARGCRRWGVRIRSPLWRFPSAARCSTPVRSCTWPRSPSAPVGPARGGGGAALTGVILARPRHEQLIAEGRAAGARIRLITDGDVAGALMTAWPASGIDLLVGIGGTPEGVLAASALQCMGGEIQGRLHPRSPQEAEAAEAQGYQLSRVLGTDDLVSGEDIFFAVTGITDGELLDGVKCRGKGARPRSLVMRSLTGTVRKIIATHRWDRLMPHSEIPYDRLGGPRRGWPPWA